MISGPTKKDDGRKMAAAIRGGYTYANQIFMAGPGRGVVGGE